jgi:excinuclease UvrABC ATPase subunit
MIFKVQGVCPKCKGKGTKINLKSMQNHVDDISYIKDFQYHVCMNKSCEVAYFNVQNEFLYTQLNKELGFKEYSSNNAHICYCYGIQKAQLNEHTLGYIDTKMEEYPSACSIRNPSGKCCKKYIKKMLHD